MQLLFRALKNWALQVHVAKDNSIVGDVSEMPKKIGLTDFISEIRRVEKYSDFENLVHLIQHGLRV